MSDFVLPDGDEEPQGFDAMPEPDQVIGGGSDALNAFNSAWMATLNAKRDKEAEMERTVRANAAEDMAKWTQQREVRLKAKKESNRSEEQLLLETLESEADPAGNSWERISKLIPNDADGEVNKKADLKRMRSLLIELKRDPVVSKN